MNRILLIVFVACALPLLSACAGEINLLDETKLSDSSLLTGEPCDAPCWNGIVPGETRFRDAKLIIESDERLTITDEPEAQDDNPGRTFDFAEGEHPTCCQLFSRDGETVTSFMLQMAPEILYGDVYDRLGEPEYVSAQQVSEEQGYAALLYTDIPIVLYAHVANPGTGEVSVYNEVIGAMYMGASEMEQVMVCASLHSWRGFQSFSSYADEETDFIGEGVGDEDICPTS